MAHGPVAIPPALTGGPFGAVTTEYDFLEILLDELDGEGNVLRPGGIDEFDRGAGGREQRRQRRPPGVLQPDPTTDDEGPGSLDDAEPNGRLTMRDVILVNEESNVNATLSNPQTGTFSNLFTPTIAGIVEVPVTRGWTAGDVTVSLGQGQQKVQKSFRFVNTHFEAFDDETQVPSIRAQQAPSSSPASPVRAHDHPRRLQLRRPGRSAWR